MARTWKQRLQAAANRVLNPVGLHLVRSDRAFEMDGLLARSAARGPRIETWIDVGASDGVWSLRARRRFPLARFVLFEPLAERQAALAQLARTHGFEIVAAAAGAQPGTLTFNVDPALDGSGVAAPGATGATGGRIVPVETIDRAVAARSLCGPFGLKLDTHGFELPVLEGATEVLATTELLVIEAYNFSLVPGCLRFHELCAWLEGRGFFCCDVADPMRRPSDGVFWQIDLAFVRQSHPLFTRTDFI